MEAARRREQVLELHRQGLTAMEIAGRVDVTPVTVYRILGEEGLRPNLTPEAEKARERREEAIALRHSAARHWLASGIPINVVSRWLGHSSLQTTLVYLEVLPDPLGDMGRVP